MRFWTTIGLILVLSLVGLTYEIAAGRVLAPFFGTSLVTWTAVIATVLAGFSLGSALGGFVAEDPRDVALRKVRRALAAAAVLMALSPMAVTAIYGAGARGTGGMLLTVVLAFFPASVLITLPSPLLARLAVEARPGREGSSLGIVLAAGSLGAIFGAVLAGFVTLPLIGSAATFAGCGVVALGCLGFLKAEIRAVVVPAVAVAASLLAGPVCQYESGLTCIDVVRHGSTVHLYADRTPQAAERIAPSDARGLPDLVMPYTAWIWARMDQDLGPAPAVLFLGGGGYTLPSRLLATRPQAQAVAVEIDPLVTWAVRQHMPRASAMIAKAGHDAATGAQRTSDRLGIVHADARVYLNETDRRFDAVVVDVFSSATVPAHLATRETYARLRAISDGPVYVNLIDTPDGRLARGIHAILSGLYPHVVAIQGPVSRRGKANILLAASDTPLAGPDRLPDTYSSVAISPGRAFTDDRGWVGHR